MGKNMKIKKNILKILYFALAIVLALPSFLLAGNSLIKTQQTSALAQESELTSQTISSNTREKLSNEAAGIVNTISITQSNTIFSAQSFKQLSIVRQEIERITDTSTTIEQYGKPKFDQTTLQEKSVFSYVTGEDSFSNVLTCVGAISFNYIPASENLSDKVEIFIHNYQSHNSSDYGTYFTTNGCLSSSLGENHNNPSTHSINLTLGAPDSLKTSLHKVTIYYNYYNSEESLSIAQARNYYEFYVLQTESLTADNGVLNWFKNNSPTLNNSIFQPGNHQTYSNSVSLALSEQAFVNENKENALIGNPNELFIEFWHNGNAYKFVITKIVDTYTTPSEKTNRLAVLNYNVDENTSSEKIVYYQGFYYSYADFCSKFSIQEILNESALSFEARVKNSSGKIIHVYQDVSNIFLAAYSETNGHYYRLPYLSDFNTAGFFTYFPFEVSGDYTVRIYDNTSIINFPTSYQDSFSNVADYAYANKFEYNFNIINENDLGGFYYTLISQKEGNTTNINKHFIVSAEERPNNDNFTSDLQVQSVNQPVTLSFYNINSETIQEIYYDRYSLDGSNVLAQKQIIAQTQSEPFVPTNYQNNNNPYNAQLTLADEGTYYLFIIFKINLKTGQTPTSIADFTLVRIAFQILNGIRQSYNYLGTVYPSSENELSNNTVKNYNFSQSYSSAFNIAPRDDDQRAATFNTNNNQRTDLYHLYGSVESSFKLQIARSVPTIDGVKNQATLNEAVNLTLSGVATTELSAHIVVKRDGATIFDRNLYNLSDESPFSFNLSYGASDLGNYVVTITDAMNNSSSIQFKIAKQQNFAAILLIVVGVAIGASALIFIVRARSKVTVR